MRGRKYIKRLAFIGALALAIGIVLSFSVPTAPEKPKIEGHAGVTVAHAQVIDPTSGCAACHTQPITAACTDCHTPPTMIGTNQDIYFPHHDTSPGGPPDDCHNSVCHDGVQGDARYVQIVTASHQYCGQCHSRTHSSPPG